MHVFSLCSVSAAQTAQTAQAAQTAQTAQTAVADTILQRPSQGWQQQQLK